MYLNIYQKIPCDISAVCADSILHSKYIKCDNNVLAVVKANSDGEFVAEGMCCFFTVDEVIHDLDSNTFSYKVTITTDNCTPTVTIPKLTITSRRFTELSAYGLTVNESLTKDFLEHFLLAEKSAKFVTVSSRIGWKDGHFWGYEKDDLRCTHRVKLSESGNYDTDQLNALLNGAEYLQLALTISASSAVQGCLGQELPLSSMIYHFYGDSSQGKTTALLTTSVWGKPTVDEGLFSTWNQTELSITNLLANNFGVTVALDESSISRFDLTSTIYNISQGVNRQRLQKNQQQQPTKQWLTTVLSSGESSLLEHTKENSGLKVRVIEFSEAITLSAEHSNNCKKFFLSNYGYIGKRLVEKLESVSVSKLTEKYEAEKKAFLNAVPEGEKHPLTDRLVESFALLTLTAKILDKLGVAVGDPAQLLVKKNKEIGSDYNIGAKVYEAVCEHIIRKKHLYPLSNSPFQGISAEGMLTQSGDLIILKSVFEEILRQNGFTSRLVCLRALDKLGVLKKQRTDTYYSQRVLNGLSAKVVVLAVEKNKKQALQEPNSYALDLIDITDEGETIYDDSEKMEVSA